MNTQKSGLHGILAATMFAGLSGAMSTGYLGAGPTYITLRERKRYANAANPRECKNQRNRKKAARKARQRNRKAAR